MKELLNSGTDRLGLGPASLTRTHPLLAGNDTVSTSVCRPVINMIFVFHFSLLSNRAMRDVDTSPES